MKEYRIVQFDQNSFVYVCKYGDYTQHLLFRDLLLDQYIIIEFPNSYNIELAKELKGFYRLELQNTILIHNIEYDYYTNLEQISIHEMKEKHPEYLI